MTGIVRTCCLSVVALAVVAPAQADEQAEARKIIDKAIQAHGGAEALGKFPALTMKAKGNFFGMGAGIEYNGIFATGPDCSRFEVSMTIANEAITVVSVLKGDKGWMALNKMVQDLTKEQIAENQESLHVAAVNRLVCLTGKDFKLSTVGEVEIEKKPALGVRVEYKGRRDVNLFFDKESGLLVKTETRAKDAFVPAEEFTAESYHRDYKKLNGVMVAHKIEVKRDGKLFVDGEVTEYSPSDKLDDVLFNKP